MSILLKNARIYDTRSEYHLKRADILIEDGIIKKIKSRIKSSTKTQVVESENLSVSPGWLDVGAYNGEPGHEALEDLNSLKMAAAAGGYLYLATLPTTSPTIDNKSQISYLQKNNDKAVTEILPLACATQGAQGAVISEIIDLDQSGAVAYTDGPDHQINRAQLMRVLQYLRRIDGIYIHYLKHDCLVSHGQINEGTQSMKLGLVGMPKTEERLEALNAVEIARYVGTDVHIHNISTPEVIQKTSDIKVSYSVPFLNLIHTDQDLEGFDTNLKVIPPLREPSDRKGLIKLINQGKINCINSNHRPVLREDKDKEFGMAKFGNIGLQHCYRALHTHATKLEHERLIYCLSQGAYEYLKLEAPKLQAGQQARLTVFDPDASSTIEQSYSKCGNNPVAADQLSGSIIGVINGVKNTFN